MKKLLIGLLTLGSLSSFAQNDRYNLGCGIINSFVVDVLLEEQGVLGTYKVELEISKGVYTSSYVKDAGLIDRIESFQNQSKKVCMSTRYDSDTESSFVDFVSEL